MVVRISPSQGYYNLESLSGTHRFSVEEYHRLLDLLILKSGDPVELLEGYVTRKLDRGPDIVPSPLFPQFILLRRWTPDEYHRMIAAGVLTTEDRVELLDGYLVNKMPQNNPHSSTVDRLDEDLKRLVPSGWRVRIQLPVTLARSEPEPDAAVVRGGRRTYDHRHPNGTDFGVVLEVADTTLARARDEKGSLYAEAGIPEYWIVNIPDRQVEVYTDPQPAATPPAYATRTDHTPGRSVPLVLDGQTVGTISVADLLP